MLLSRPFNCWGGMDRVNYYAKDYAILVHFPDNELDVATENHLGHPKLFLPKIQPKKLVLAFHEVLETHVYSLNHRV